MTAARLWYQQQVTWHGIVSLLWSFVILMLIMGAISAVIGALYEWFTMPSHAAYAALAVILLVYLGLFLLGLAALYVVVRVIRAAWRHGSGPAITEILRDEPLDRDA